MKVLIFGSAGLVGKSLIANLNKSKKVSEVIAKIKSEGIFNTLEAVNNKLDKPLPLGYCNAGIIVEVGEDWCQGRMTAVAKEGCYLKAGASARYMQTYAAGR